MKFLLQCKYCGNKMQYEAKNGEIMGKSKTCVYCGRSFSVRQGVRKKLV